MEQTKQEIKNEFIEKLTEEMKAAPVNRNGFFIRFKNETLNPEQLKRFAGQYFWFCKNFIRVLVGLIYNTPAEEDDMRLELVKTLYSELGYGKKDDIHLNLLRKFTKALDFTDEDLQKIKPIPEVRNYIEQLGSTFLKTDFREALGAEFAVEITALPEFTYLYPGIRKYVNLSDQDIIFFKFHLAEEELHGEWLTEAVLRIVKTEEDKALIRKGAVKAAQLWGEFWEGMYRYVFEEEKT